MCCAPAGPPACSVSRLRLPPPWAPSCAFRWGHVRQLDRVSRELLARVWKAGAGPGDAPFTIDLDSTICETLAKEGARHHGYTGARGYRRADGPPARGPGQHRPRLLTSCVKRWGGCATGQTVRADSGSIPTPWLPSFAIRQRARLRNLPRPAPPFLTGWMVPPPSVG